MKISPRSYRHMRAAFTLIALLISILLPSLGKAKAQAQTTACAANLKQLGLAFMEFGSEHNGRLPGSQSQWNGGPYSFPEEWKNDWLAGTDTTIKSDYSGSITNPVGFYAQPTKGTIYLYVKTVKAYRCPSLPLGSLFSGIGSNGQYDYTMPQYLCGARIDLVPRVANVQDRNLRNVGPMPMLTGVPVPILVEEDPAANVNTRGNTDGAWCWFDQVTKNHQNGTNIAAGDGSVVYQKVPKGFGFQANSFIITTRHGGAMSNTTDGYGVQWDGAPWAWFDSQ